MPRSKNPIHSIHAWRSVLACLIALASFTLAPLALARGPLPGQFDYYALSLSWSPTYCGSNAGQNDPQQCGPGRAYAFVVHGLWPQYAQGWPENCRAEKLVLPPVRGGGL